MVRPADGTRFRYQIKEVTDTMSPKSVTTRKAYSKEDELANRKMSQFAHPQNCISPPFFGGILGVAHFTPTYGMRWVEHDC